MASATGGILRVSSGISIVALLIVAPLHYGSTRSGGIEWLWAGTGFATVCWCMSLIADRRPPSVPPLIWVFSSLLLVSALPWAVGWIQATPTASFTTAHFSRIAARWPECITWWNQSNQTGLISGLALLIVVVSDLSSNRIWTITFASVIAAVGVIVAIIAFAQIFWNAKTIFLEPGTALMTNFSGTFYHHTTAGAYLNTAWPVGFGLAWMGWKRTGGWSRLPIAALASLGTITVLGAHGAHVSRMPQVLAAAAVAALIFVLASSDDLSRKLSKRAKLAFASGTTCALVLLTLIIIVYGKSHQIAARWHDLWSAPRAVASHVAGNPPEASWERLMRDDLIVSTNEAGGLLGARGIAYESAGAAILHRPWFGHGPANWIGAASEYCADPFVRTFFQFVQFAHQDLLQFMVEWGVIGSLGWWGLLAGAPLRVALSRFFKTPSNPIRISASIALAAVLLQAQWDFPLQMAAVTLNAAVLAGLCWSSDVRERARQLNLPRAEFTA